MKLTRTSKWIASIVIALTLLAAAVLLFFQSEIDHMLGGNTAVVDHAQFKALSGPIAIINANILSEDSKSMLPNHSVLIKDQIIQMVGQNIKVPDGYHIIDGSGQYLIPGLIDAHVHIKKSKNDLLLYLANGITHVGEMTGMIEHFKYREQIKNGAFGPDIFIASPKMTSQEGMRATMRSMFEKRHQSFTTAAKGREAVRNYQSKGYEAIKISSDLSTEIYFAINDEADKQGIPVIGHLPTQLGMTDFYRARQSQLGHISSITQAEMNAFGGISHENPEAFLQHIRDNADQIASKLKQKNTVVASTLWLYETIPSQDINLSGFLKTIPLEYQNPGWLEGSVVSKGWLPGNSSYENPNKTDPESIRKSQTFWSTYVKANHIITRALVRQGVSIVAGTDAHGAVGVIAGFSLHDELESLNKAGLSQTQVLHTATVAPAQWMKLNTGTIKTGYEADLVLLNKNPLDDISNTRQINGVITNGRYLNRTELDRMLKTVKQANNNSRKVSIDAYLE